MAVPTLISATPSTTRTGGRVLVKLTGSGFALPAPPPPTGKAPPAARSVLVRFGGVLAQSAFAVSSTEAYALAPPHIKGAVDVTLQNLDAQGPIAGELATLVAGFTYRLPDLAREGRIAAVVRALLQALKREVLENTSMTTHSEYDPTTGDQLSVIDVGSLPAIVLSGLRLPTSRTYAQNVRRAVAGPGDVTFFLRPSETVDLVLTISAGTDATVQLQNLAGELKTFFQRNPYLEVVVAGRADPLRYEMQADFGGLETQAKPSESNVRQFSGELIVRGVDLDEEDMRVGLGRAVHDYVVEGAPAYSPEEASRTPQWPVILGSSANASVTPENTPADGVDFEQFEPPGEEP